MLVVGEVVAVLMFLALVADTVRRIFNHKKGKK